MQRGPNAERGGGSGTAAASGEGDGERAVEAATGGVLGAPVVAIAAGMQTCLAGRDLDLQKTLEH